MTRMTEYRGRRRLGRGSWPDFCRESPVDSARTFPCDHTTGEASGVTDESSEVDPHPPRLRLFRLPSQFECVLPVPHPLSPCLPHTHPVGCPDLSLLRPTHRNPSLKRTVGVKGRDYVPLLSLRAVLTGPVRAALRTARKRIVPVLDPNHDPPTPEHRPSQIPCPRVRLGV